MSATACPVHGQPWKLVPAGVSSKTGRPYAAFWACPESGCREKPEAAPQSRPAPAVPSQTTPATKTLTVTPRASERAILIAGCLNLAGRVFQSSSDMQSAAVCARELFAEWEARL